MQSVLSLIGMNLKVARTRKSITQSELACMLNVEQSYISKLERGTVAASCERIYEIMQILECESKDIFPAVNDVTTKFQ